MMEDFTDVERSMILKIAARLMAKGEARVRVRKGRMTASRAKKLLEQAAKVADVKVKITAESNRSVAEVK